MTYLDCDERGRRDAEEGPDPEGPQIHADHRGHNVDEPVREERRNPNENKAMSLREAIFMRIVCTSEIRCS